MCCGVRYIKCVTCLCHEACTNCPPVCGFARCDLDGLCPPDGYKNGDPIMGCCLFECDARRVGDSFTVILSGVDHVQVCYSDLESQNCVACHCFIATSITAP